jgi:phospholipid N-methyltransferase
MSNYGLFLREFRRTFHTTGAILPSSARLGRALARFVPNAESNGHPRRILEAGPGTGAVTGQIVARLGTHDRLELVELNERFVAHLRERFARDEAFAAVAPRTQIHQAAVQDLPGSGEYDVIVSGLPLNNFSVELAESILASFRRLLAPGGTLSFFEYVAVRPLRTAVSGRNERRRLRGLTELLGTLCRQHEFARQMVVANVPPAWVHHVRFK